MAGNNKMDSRIVRSYLALRNLLAAVRIPEESKNTTLLRSN